MSTNRLYFGDCLDVMRDDIPTESVDLIYLDPPFNSRRLYNAFIGGAQWVAFDDTWRWHEAVNDFHQVASQPAYGGLMDGLRLMLGEGPQLAYLSYMANRLVECHRVLKPTGSIYIHCDPTMSHGLKLVMDALFGTSNFRNEITWVRSLPHNDAHRFGRSRDTILWYVRSDQAKFVPQYRPQKELSVKAHYQKGKDGRYYQLVSLVAPGGRGPLYEFKGFKRNWRFTPEKMVALEAEGRIWHESGKLPRRIVFLEESKGALIQDHWDDISPMNAMAKERLGYPTQKPLALLRRIIQASSSEGDTVLDPFCGCGTTLHAAQSLGREWIGIDICVNACKVIEQRLKGHFDSLWDNVDFIGMPKTRDDARFMAGSDPFRFERWAASLVDGMEANKKQHGDHGIDGWGRLPIKKGKFIDMVSQVKGGHTNPGHVQAFNGARQQANADLGIFTCFEDRVTNGMRDAAVNTGKFMSAPVVQIYTVEDYFEGRKPALPVAA